MIIMMYSNEVLDTKTDILSCWFPAKVKAEFSLPHCSENRKTYNSYQRIPP